MTHNLFGMVCIHVSLLMHPAYIRNSSAVAIAFVQPFLLDFAMCCKCLLAAAGMTVQDALDLVLFGHCHGKMVYK